jgi:hypothetical protein
MRPGHFAQAAVRCVRPPGRVRGCRDRLHEPRARHGVAAAAQGQREHPRAPSVALPVARLRRGARASCARRSSPRPMGSARCRSWWPGRRAAPSMAALATQPDSTPIWTASKPCCRSPFCVAAPGRGAERRRAERVPRADAEGAVRLSPAPDADDGCGSSNGGVLKGRRGPSAPAPKITSAICGRVLSRCLDSQQ